MLETAKGIAPGIPVFMSEPLKALVDQAKAQKALNDNEVCGLFLFHASDWVPGTGWIGDIVYKAVENSNTESSAFTMEPVAAAIHMSEAVDMREAVATAVCEREGWDSETPWSEAVKMDTAAQIEAMRKDGIVIDAVRAQEHIDRALYEEMMDIAEGFNPYAVKQGYISIPSEGADDGVRRMSAHTWLMCRGVAVLCGIGHSHPGGSTTLSPEDFLATKVVEEWRRVFAVRFTTEGQKSGSLLELPRSVGSWIYALPEDSSSDAHSSVVRYDKRGVRGSWTGPF